VAIALNLSESDHHFNISQLVGRKTQPNTCSKDESNRNKQAFLINYFTPEVDRHTLSQCFLSFSSKSRNSI